MGVSFKKSMGSTKKEIVLGGRCTAVAKISLRRDGRRTMFNELYRGDSEGVNRNQTGSC
jgi:hypothetical protein